MRNSPITSFEIDTVNSDTFPFCILSNQKQGIKCSNNLPHSRNILKILDTTLSNLIATYKHHLSNICKRKHGTRLYRTGCDLLTTLSNALYKSKTNSKVQSESVLCASQSIDVTVEKINLAMREQIFPIYSAYIYFIISRYIFFFFLFFCANFQIYSSFF